MRQSRNLFNTALLFGTALFFIVGCLFCSHNVYGESDSRLDEEIRMIKGDLDTIKVFTLTRVSVTNPAVADIVDIDDDNIVVLAKGSGKTILFIWDSYGKRSISIRIPYKKYRFSRSRFGIC